MQSYARSFVRGVGTRFALACASTLLAFTAIELGYRAHAQRPVFVLDDWRAEGIEYRTFGDQVVFDPALGWVPTEEYESDDYNTLALGIRRNFSEKAVRTGGVLAVGDVFTNGGTEVADGETWPAHLERMLGVPVLNGGVAGYAADQIVMRAEQLLPVVQPKTLVVALFEEDISLTGFSSFGTSKPYYMLDKGQLAYHAPSRVAIDEKSPSGWCARTRSLLGHSAVLHMVLGRLTPGYWYGSASEETSQRVDNDPVGVTCALLQRLKTRADADGIRTLLLMQHARQTIAGDTQPGEDARKVSACAAAMAIDVVDHFDALRAIAVANPDALSDLYVQGEGYGQMSPEGNRHAAELLARTLAK